MSVLGVATCNKAKVAKLFFEADSDGSGEIDFDEVSTRPSVRHDDDDDARGSRLAPRSFAR